MALLMHSMSHFAELIDQALAFLQPRRLVEIGSEYGGSTRVLLEYAAVHGAHVDVVDPHPFTDLSLALQEFSGHYEHHRRKSVDALETLQAADFYLIDGDHNYWTVSQELQKIHRGNPEAWMFLHDVGFPSGRRDSYYNPADIPAEFLHPHSFTDGATFADELEPGGGFRGEGDFAVALHQGGPANGVLTAIEDFLASSQGLYFQMIQPIFGLGIIVPARHKDFIDVLVAPYQTPLMASMEANRMELYLKVLELQGQLAEASRRLEGPGLRRRLARLITG